MDGQFWLVGICRQMTYSFSVFYLIRNWIHMKLGPVQSAIVIAAKGIVPLVKGRSLGMEGIVNFKEDFPRSLSSCFILV